MCVKGQFHVLMNKLKEKTKKITCRVTSINRANKFQHVLVAEEVAREYVRSLIGATYTRSIVEACLMHQSELSDSPGIAKLDLD